MQCIQIWSMLFVLGVVTSPRHCSHICHNCVQCVKVVNEELTIEYLRLSEAGIPHMTLKHFIFRRCSCLFNQNCERLQIFLSQFNSDCYISIHTICKYEDVMEFGKPNAFKVHEVLLNSEGSSPFILIVLLI